ncbi:MAG: MarC family protein [Thiobacillaceae bacterium]|jgi:multiple antibiotic resistance protein
MEIHELLKFTLSLFAIVDPVGIIPVFLASTEGFSIGQRRAAAWVSALTVFSVLVLFAFGGTLLLDFFGVRLASFSVGGGLILLILAVAMAQARVSPIRQTPEEAQEAMEKEAVGAVPLGVPLLAGPGAITHVIVASSGKGSEQWLHHLSLVPSIFLIAFSVWLSFRLSPVIARKMGTTGIHVVTRLMGLIIAGIAVEMMANGFGQLFPGLLGQ